MPTADTNNNIIVTIYDGIATLGTDYNTSGVSSSIHIPHSKMIWGNQNESYRVGLEYPMPVNVLSFNGNSGASYLMGVTGSVYGLGTFTVGNTSTNPLYVVGVSGSTHSPVQIKGTIQGITSGILVGITTGPILFSNTSIGIYGISGGTAMAITGGRYLNNTTDSIRSIAYLTGLSMTTGLVGSTTDSVRIFGSSGEKYIPTVLNYLSGNTLFGVGMSGDAVKVSIQNTGFTFTVNLSTSIGVTNGTESALKIQGGTAGDNPVLIKYYNNSSVPVTISSVIQTEMVTVGSTYDNQIKSIITALTGSTGNIQSIKDSTNLISTINDKLSTNGVTVRISEISKPNRIVNGTSLFTSSSNVVQLPSNVLKSGINLKTSSSNTSTVYVGNNTIVSTKETAYPLEPGESIFIECNNTNLIFCYSIIDPTKQKLIYMGS
jgi:hypothetical protein